MKKKSLFLALMIIMIEVITTACSQTEYTLNLPTEAIGVTLLKNGDSRTVETAENIENVLNMLGGTERITAEESVQDSPVDSDEEIKIDFIFDEGAISTLFVYEKNGKYYIEQPYNGIYEITQDEYNNINTFYQGL